MQRQTKESDQGSISNNSGMSQRSSMNNFLNPVESSIPNNTASYDEASCVNVVNHNVQSFSEWNSGESSSRLSLQNNQASNDGSIMEEWLFSVGPRSEERRFEFEPSHSFIPDIGIDGNQLRNPPSFSQGSSSNNISPNLGYLGESEQASTSLSSDVGPSGSSSYLMEDTSGGPGGWGLSCKRKALEGTSGHSYPCGSSSCFPPQAENGSARHNNASSSLSLSPPSRHSPSLSPEMPHTRIGLGMRGVASSNFPPSGVGGITDPVRNSGNQQESLAFNLSSGGSRRSSAWSVPQPFRPVSPSDLSAPTTNPTPSQGPLHRIAPSRSRLLPWNRPSSSRDAAFRDDLSSGEVSRTSSELAMFVPYMGQDPSGWSLATGNMSASSASVSSTRNSPSLSIHPLPAPTWFPHHNFPAPAGQQRFPEFAPWSLFPSMETESGGQTSHFPPLSSAPSQETVMNSGSSGQQNPRGAFGMEGQGNVLGMARSLRSLAADIEGRHRLISEIRQVLNAMRRGENLRIEDHMLFDPFMHHGIAEMHDRHRDMRLDVDNMSYEELLALEERIGDVNTGLTEGTILKLMKQTKYFSITTESRIDLEPCSICQEQYINGDEVGKLECGHEYHTNCIKQWLMLKNLCPICKTTALPT